MLRLILLYVVALPVLVYKPCGVQISAVALLLQGVHRCWKRRLQYRYRLNVLLAWCATVELRRSLPLPRDTVIAATVPLQCVAHRLHNSARQTRPISAFANKVAYNGPNAGAATRKTGYCHCVSCVCIFGRFA